MISAIFILNNLGNVIISRVFREDVKYSVVEVFQTKIINVRSKDLKNPILTLGSTSFLYVKIGDIYYVAITRNNSDASLILQYLNKLIDLLKSLILVSPDQILKDHQLMDNFLLIYEVLDLTIDQGFVKQIDDSLLISKIYSPITKAIGNDNNQLDKSINDIKIIKKDLTLIDKIDLDSALSLLGKDAISLIYNEYISVEERKVKILGEVFLISNLSSNININFQFIVPQVENSFLYLENITIPPIQKLNKLLGSTDIKFDLDCSISNPTETILNYSANTLFNNLPIIITGSYKQLTIDKFELDITLECRYPTDINAKNITIRIPIPKNVSKQIDFQSMDSKKFIKDENIERTDDYLIWSLDSVSGNQYLKLNKMIYVDSSSKLSDWISTRGNVKVSFEIPNYNITEYSINSFNVVGSINNSVNKIIQSRSLTNKNYEFYI